LPLRRPGGVREGVRVSAIDVRGAGWRAGLREGDVVLAIDGQRVTDRASFRKAASESRGLARVYGCRNGKHVWFALRGLAGQATAAKADAE
jgi:S1-C subfamily serine protease